MDLEIFNWFIDVFVYQLVRKVFPNSLPNQALIFVEYLLSNTSIFSSVQCDCNLYLMSWSMLWLNHSESFKYHE